MKQQQRIIGMTPDQIRKAHNKKPAKSIGKVAKVPIKQHAPKAIKAQRLTSPFKNPRLLLETPVVASQIYVPFRAPEWFETKDKADVSVIIPLYKSNQAVRDLIRSWDILNDGLKVEIIYVDDCCPYGSKEAVISEWESRKEKLRWPVGKILYSPENQGFGASCNIGARHATGDFLIFLNPNTTVTTSWIKPIIRQLRKDDVGIVGNMQLKTNGHDVIDSIGSEWNWSESAFLHIGRDSFDGKRISKPFAITNSPADAFETTEREMVTGACLAIKKQLFEEIGGFNPNYRLARWEDAEICMNVKELGYKIIYQPNSRIYRLDEQTSDHKFVDHNRSYFMNKWVSSGRIDPLVKAKREKPEVKTIVIRRQAAHGDVLMASAVAPALKKLHPNCTILFSTLCPNVLENNPHIDKIVTDQELSERAFTLYYNLDMAYEYRPNTNILKAYADVVGVKVEDCKLHLHTSPVADLPEDYIVIHAGHTKWAGRDWSPTKFDILSNQLQQAGHAVICVGMLRDNRVSCDLDLRGKTTVAELAYVIQKSKLFVGIDSFPMHIAQTFDKPGVCFFGSIHPSTRIISNKMQPVTAVSLKCLGCHHRQMPPCTVTATCETQFLDCVNNVTVMHMMNKIQESLG